MRSKASNVGNMMACLHMYITYLSICSVCVYIYIHSMIGYLDPSTRLEKEHGSHINDGRLQARNCQWVDL